MLVRLLPVNDGAKDDVYELCLMLEVAEETEPYVGEGRYAEAGDRAGFGPEVF